MDSRSVSIAEAMRVSVSFRVRGSLGLFFFVLLFHGCAPISREPPTVADENLQHFVGAIGLQVVAVSELRDRWANYRFKLVDFARRDILGLSTGNHTIYISYELSRLAYKNDYYRWMLRHTLAHEIAHDVLGGDIRTGDDGEQQTLGQANRITSRDMGLSDRITFRPYSRSAELAADRKGLEYWQKLGWSCVNWVQLFENFTAQGYEGDVDHPTQDRLRQARQICSAQSMFDNFRQRPLVN